MVDLLVPSRAQGSGRGHNEVAVPPISLLSQTARPPRPPIRCSVAVWSGCPTFLSRSQIPASIYLTVFRTALCSDICLPTPPVAMVIFTAEHFPATASERSAVSDFGQDLIFQGWDREYTGLQKFKKPN